MSAAMGELLGLRVQLQSPPTLAYSAQLSAWMQSQIGSPPIRTQDDANAELGLQLLAEQTAAWTEDVAATPPGDVVSMLVMAAGHGRAGEAARCAARGAPGAGRPANGVREIPAGA
jgi:hypothetical protein